MNYYGKRTVKKQMSRVNTVKPRRTISTYGLKGPKVNGDQIRDI